MSSPSRQRRPTRAETRTRLLDAAARVFSAQGIAAASVEAIADEAGFSRGAVYSNFADKDDLVIALLRKMTDDSVREIEELMAANPDQASFIRATQSMMASPERRGGSYSPVLSTELVLYALRNPQARPMLIERLDRWQAAILEVIERNAATLGLDPADNRPAIAAMIAAMDEGFALHSMIDPGRDSVAAYSTALDFIAEAGDAIAYRYRHEKT
jgi:AcrR family transcriptional regulator